MPTPDDYRDRAQSLETEAAKLPEGFERQDLLRRAWSLRDLATSLDEQDARRQA